MKLSIDVAPVEVQAWTATAKTRDFRDAVWNPRSIAGSGDGERTYQFAWPKPVTGCMAAFAEVKFPGETMPFYLSTGLRVVEPGAGAPEATGL